VRSQWHAGRVQVSCVASALSATNGLSSGCRRAYDEGSEKKKLCSRTTNPGDRACHWPNHATMLLHVLARGSVARGEGASWLVAGLSAHLSPRPGESHNRRSQIADRRSHVGRGELDGGFLHAAIWDTTQPGGEEQKGWHSFTTPAVAHQRPWTAKRDLPVPVPVPVLLGPVLLLPGRALPGSETSTPSSTQTRPPPGPLPRPCYLPTWRRRPRFVAAAAALDDLA
jgi:hypothetical protein